MDSQAGWPEHRDDEDLVLQASRLLQAGVVGVIAGEGVAVQLANDCFLGLLGYSRGELEDGLDWASLTPPEWLEQDATGIEELKTSGHVGPIHKEYLHRDGHRVPVMIGGVLISADPFRWCSVVVDLSAEREAVAEAQRLSSLWEAVSSEVPVGLAVFNREMRLVTMNRKLEAINKRRLEDHVGRGVDELFAGEQGVMARSYLDQVLSTGRRVDAPTPSRIRTGTEDEMVTMSSFFPVHNSTGDVINAACSVVDITDRVRLEDELRLEQRRRQELIDGLFSFVGSLDADGVLRDANRTALEAGGLSPDDVLGRPFEETHWWSHDPSVQSRLSEAINRAKQGETSRYDEVIRVKGEQLIWIDFQLVPIVEDAQTKGMTVSGLDITERRALRDQIEALADLGRTLSRSATTSDVAAAVVDPRFSPVVGASFCNVGIVDEHGWIEIVQPADLVASIADRYVRLPVDAPVVISGAVRDGRFMGISGPGDEDGRFAASWGDVRATGLQSVAGVPLKRQDGSVGAVLGLGWAEPMDFEDRNLRNRIDVLAEMVGQCLERTRISDLRSEFVRSLQTELLPNVPVIDGLDLTVCYRPATSEIGFGGDWYDVIPLGDQVVAVVVGDVVGHGVQAAAQMARMRGVIDGVLSLHASSAGHRIDALLAQARDALARNGEQFLSTARITVLDLGRRRWSTAGAGHPPLLRCRSDGTIEYVYGGRQPPLGLSSKGAAVQDTDPLAIETGDTLLMFTDGLIEASRQGVDEGLSELGEIAALHRSDTLDDFVDAVVRHVVPDERHQNDDVALVAMRLG